MEKMHAKMWDKIEGIEYITIKVWESQIWRVGLHAESQRKTNAAIRDWRLLASEKGRMEIKKELQVKAAHTSGKKT